MEERLRLLVGVGSGVGGRTEWRKVLTDFCGVLGLGAFEADGLCGCVAEVFCIAGECW